MKPLIFLLPILLISSHISAKRPNILFIFSDDHAYQAISAYGSNRNQTPNLDRIAKEGMRFDRAFVTNSICAPSRAVVLTGKHSHLNGQLTNGETFDGSQQTFPKLLQKAGYQTALFGKWHLKSSPTGFDSWEVLRGQGPYYNPLFLTPKGNKNITGYTTDIITDRTLDWLKNKRDSEQPFFLCSWHKAPHRNWLPAPKYMKKYDDKDIPEPDTLRDDYRNRLSPASSQTMTIDKHMRDDWDFKLTPPRELNEEQKKIWNSAYEPKNKAFREAKLEGNDLLKWKYQRYAKDYLRCIDSVDENIGRLLNYLDESGLAENTIVIYSSDQGWYLGNMVGMINAGCMKSPSVPHSWSAGPELSNLAVSIWIWYKTWIMPRPFLISAEPNNPWTCREGLCFLYSREKRLKTGENRSTTNIMNFQAIIMSAGTMAFATISIN